MKILTTFALLTASAFCFTSCGDDKEETTEETPKETPAVSKKDQIFNEAIALFESTAESVKTKGMDALKEMEPKMNALQERAKALGYDMKDKSTLSDEQQEKLKAVQGKLRDAMMKASQK